MFIYYSFTLFVSHIFYKVCLKKLAPFLEIPMSYTLYVVLLVIFSSNMTHHNIIYNICIPTIFRQVFLTIFLFYLL